MPTPRLPARLSGFVLRRAWVTRHMTQILSLGARLTHTLDPDGSLFRMAAEPTAIPFWPVRADKERFITFEQDSGSLDHGRLQVLWHLTYGKIKTAQLHPRCQTTAGMSWKLRPATDADVTRRRGV